MGSMCWIKYAQSQMGYMAPATMLNLPVVYICTSLPRHLCHFSFRRL